MTFASFVGDLGSRPKRLTVLNRTQPDPILRMLEKVFAGNAVEIREVETDDGTPTDVLVLSCDGETLATSTLSDVRDTLLLVNSDTYITGTRSLEQVETPAVLAELADTRFRLAGYPIHEKQKMLLIEISRHIESRAVQVGNGTLRSGFQYLARLDDEHGTLDAYGALGATDVDVHLYGVPNWTPPPSFGTIHGSDDAELRRSWFVTFEHPGEDADDAALLAVETDRNRWEGFWTYREDLVADIAGYAADTYG
jgi:hypothetical protein